MQVMIKADDGDLVLVRVDDLAIEQAVVRLEFENSAYQSPGDLESVSLTSRRARDLGRALLLAARIVDDAAQDRELPPARARHTEPFSQRH